MEIYRLKSKNSHLDGYSIRLKREEAYEILISLLFQVSSNNPNKERKEFLSNITAIGETKRKKSLNYFTISVESLPKSTTLDKDEVTYILRRMLTKRRYQITSPTALSLLSKLTADYRDVVRPLLEKYERKEVNPNVSQSL